MGELEKMLLPLACFTPIYIWCQNLAYRQGICDGAFNHFLPTVRQEMLRYDKWRAEKIFEKEGEQDACR